VFEEKVNTLDYDSIQYYLDHCINRIFAILGIYEDCNKRGDMKDFHIYLSRLVTEFSGLQDLFKLDILISLIGILQGMNINEDIKHSEVKSLVFHCISLIKRGAKENGVL
jgi:hypothetical protein